MILKRGDRIHMCVPESLARSSEKVKEINDFYLSYGVAIAMMSYTSTITHPVIIAVMPGGDRD